MDEQHLCPFCSRDLSVWRHRQNCPARGLRVIAARTMYDEWIALFDDIDYADGEDKEPVERLFAELEAKDDTT